MKLGYSIYDLLVECIRSCHPGYVGRNIAHIELEQPEFDTLIYTSLVEYAHGDNNARD